MTKLLIRFIINFILQTSFNIAHVRMIGSLEYKKTIYDYFKHANINSAMNLGKYHAENFSKTTIINMRSALG